jgi:hypothetical protein
MSNISELVESYRTACDITKARVIKKAKGLVKLLRPAGSEFLNERLVTANSAEDNIGKLSLLTLSSVIIAKVIIHPQETYDTLNYFYMDNPLVASFAWTLSGVGAYIGLHRYAKTHMP